MAAPAPAPAPAANQTGGVYLIINPNMRDNGSEARVTRSRSTRHRGAVRWAGMEGGGDGAASFGDHDAAAGASGATEVTVQKMD